MGQKNGVGIVNAWVWTASKQNTSCVFCSGCSNAGALLLVQVGGGLHMSCLCMFVCFGAFLQLYVKIAYFHGYTVFEMMSCVLCCCVWLPRVAHIRCQQRCREPWS